MLHAHSAHLHGQTSTHMHLHIPADGELLEYIHVNGFACMQRFTQRHLCREGWKWMYSLWNKLPWRDTHTQYHTVVSLLLIFCTAVAFMHLQVIIGCLQLRCIMELCSSSFLSSSFSSQGRAWVHAILHLECTHAGTCEFSDTATYNFLQ